MSSNLSDQRAHWLKEKAIQAGFQFAGIAKAEFMTQEARQLESWLKKGYHGKMEYMENHFDLRVDPSKLVPGAKSVISLLYNYSPTRVQNNQAGVNISKYAYGEDYHKVIRRKLKALVREMKGQWGDFQSRVFVDSGPVLERDWAKRSGAGWIGKHTLLISPKAGSYFFLAEIILDIDLTPDHPIKDYCGTCTRCIDACPTAAISPQGYLLDGSKCISYLTIELKEQIPDEFHSKLEGWAFGCDICQDVCPWNRFAKPNEVDEFTPRPELLSMNTEEWVELKEDKFNYLFDHTPVKRAGFQKFKDSIRIVSHYLKNG